VISFHQNNIANLYDYTIYFNKTCFYLPEIEL